MSLRPGRGDPATALYADVVQISRRLKRTHRAYYHANHADFLHQVRKAQSQVFRLKPGPKEDAMIARAARERARGAPWGDLIVRYLDLPVTVSEFTRNAAEEGFKRKVGRFLQRHRQLRRKWAKQTGAKIPTRNPKP